MNAFQYASMCVCLHYVRVYIMHECRRLYGRVCVWACMRVGVYAWMRVCVYACMRVCVYACIYVCLRGGGGCVGKAMTLARMERHVPFLDGQHHQVEVMHFVR